MSSLAASRADNFYFPPEWRPEFGGISKFQGSKGANQYQQHGIIRFELPFDGWCAKCSRHLAKGKRFNAKKEQAGKYFTTTLYEFQMKCPSCDQEIIIKTDPENRTYNYVSGINKMEHSYELPVDNNEDVLVIGSTAEEKMKLAKDSIYKLQNDNINKHKSESINENIQSLISRNEVKGSDYGVNSALRKKFREEKKDISNQLKEGVKRHVNYPILPLPSDASVVFQRKNHAQVFDRNEQSKLRKIATQSIFNSTSVSNKLPNRTVAATIPIEGAATIPIEGAGNRKRCYDQVTVVSTGPISILKKR